MRATELRHLSKDQSYPSQVIFYIVILYLIRNSIRSIINSVAYTSSGKGRRRKTIQHEPVAPLGGDSGHAERSYATPLALGGWLINSVISVVVGSKTTFVEKDKRYENN